MTRCGPLIPSEAITRKTHTDGHQQTSCGDCHPARLSRRRRSGGGVRRVGSMSVELSAFRSSGWTDAWQLVCPSCSCVTQTLKAASGPPCPLRYCPVHLQSIALLWRHTQMALANCPECNKVVSDTADRCPQCGCPIARGFLGRAGTERTMNVIVLVIFSILVLFLMKSCAAQ